ncbi:MAG: hypothetical protein WC514_00085 [Candidatus Paceibacterota bacterium]
METLQKVSLFWDVRDLDPQKHARFIIERILAFGDENDFSWAVGFYGKEKIKECFLKSRSLDRKSTSFWCQYFNLGHLKCIQNQLIKKQNIFWKK